VEVPSVTTVAFSCTYHELDYDSKHDLIDHTSIFPQDNTRLPLARSLLPICDDIYTWLGPEATED
jgi:hypothetical protein